jgi:hypothetical protein
MAGIICLRFGSVSNTPSCENSGYRMVYLWSGYDGVRRRHAVFGEVISQRYVLHALTFPPVQSGRWQPRLIYRILLSRIRWSRGRHCVLFPP